MYSPKIKEDLIPQLYKIAKAKKIPMTKLVNEILSEAIKKIHVEKRVVKRKVEVKEEIFVLKENKEGEYGEEKSRRNFQKTCRQ